MKFVFYSLFVLAAYKSNVPSVLLYSLIFVNLDTFLDFQMLLCFLNAYAAFRFLISHLISFALVCSTSKVKKKVSISFILSLLACILVPLHCLYSHNLWYILVALKLEFIAFFFRLVCLFLFYLA